MAKYGPLRYWIEGVPNNRRNVHKFSKIRPARNAGRRVKYSFFSEEYFNIARRGGTVKEAAAAVTQTPSFSSRIYLLIGLSEWVCVCVWRWRCLHEGSAFGRKNNNSFYTFFFSFGGFFYYYYLFSFLPLPREKTEFMKKTGTKKKREKIIKLLVVPFPRGNEKISSLFPSPP